MLRLRHGAVAVAFDAFGTLVRIGERRRPYRRLQQLMAKYGRSPQPDDAERMMTTDVWPAGLIQQLDVRIPAAELADIEADLHAELVSISAYEDGLRALSALRERGIRIGLCSNLAKPYSIPVRLLLPRLEAYAWSFEVGACKPDTKIFQHLCRELNCAPSEALFIGDTHHADVAGPARVGMRSVLLDRDGTSGDPMALRTLDELVLPQV